MHRGHQSLSDPTPRRQIERRIKPAFSLDDCATVQELAQRLQKRIRQTLYARGAGTVVAINSQAEVYLLMAGEARTERFCVEHYDWVLGTYAEMPMCGASASVPSVGILEEDIRFHLPYWGWPTQLQLPFPPLHEMAAAA